MRQIGIDFDLHKLIEIERTSFEETENDVLRRLLNLPPTSTADATRKKVVVSRGWSGYGVTLPHGTQLQMSYNGVAYMGQIEDGDWSVGGELYTSPSGAASGVARTKKGGKTRLDGWGYWKVKRPGDTAWVGLGELWHQAKKNRKVGS